MTKLCFDNTYVIQYTDTSKGTITIPRKAFIDDEVDIVLVGKDRLEYGEEFDENLLHLLENFSAPEKVGVTPIVPDDDFTLGTLLENPIEGQIWFNSTKNRHYVYDGVKWNALGSNDDVGGNRGVILSGNSLPKPISPITSYEFDYNECSWNTSPFNLPGQVDFMECYTDANAVVTMRYRIAGSPTIYNGYANYQIIGIRGNDNQGDITPILPSGTQLPTPTVTPTPSITGTNLPTPTVTPTMTKTPNPTPTVTPTPSVSQGIEFFVSVATDSGNTTEILKLGQVTPAGFSVIASGNISPPVASEVRGNITSDGYNIFVPYYDTGTAIYTRVGSGLFRGSILNNETNVSGDYKTNDCVFHSHPTVGKLLYTLQTRSVGSVDELKIRTYIINGPNDLSLLSTSTVNVTPVSGGLRNFGACIHNNYLIVTHSEKIFAFYHNGSALNQITSVVNTVGNYIRPISDNSYIYIESRYSSLLSKPNRNIYTFSGAAFTEVLNQADGDYGLVVGGSNIFTGLDNQTAIQAKYWDGVSLGASLNSISSARPAYSEFTTLFKFSFGTNRLYNPVDNSTLSKIYTWNGISFTPLMSFNIEDIASTNKYVAFKLMYIAESDSFVGLTPAPSPTLDIS